MTKRQDKILEILLEKRQININALENILMVSSSIIQKDLNYLYELGFLKYENGYIQFLSKEDLSIRMAINYDIKRNIAKSAAETVEDGETVLIESGSCCALLAEELASKKQVTIITNSAFVAGHIRHAPFAKVLLLGGEYQNSSQVLVGSMTSKWAEIFISDKFFVSADGFSKKYGFMGKDHQRAQTARDMALQAKEVIILAESKKFLEGRGEGIVQTEQVSAVFTDEGILAETEMFLKQKNVEIHKVPVFKAA